MARRSVPRYLCTMRCGLRTRMDDHVRLRVAGAEVLPEGTAVTELAPDPSEFMSRTPALLNGNTQWASNYALELRAVIVRHASQAPRTLQRHLGPSELGAVCDRMVAGKMAAIPSTNHVADPWASIVGTALHSWLEKAFAAENYRSGMRWLTERKVTPHPEHPGTADLYDAAYGGSVVDWKNLGETSMAKVKAVTGPPIHYQVQLLLYGLGYRILGLPVRRVVLAALPRTKSTLDTMWVWEREISQHDDLLIEEVFQRTAIRKIFAKAITSGQISYMDVPATPSDDECYFCPLYRPEAAKNPSIRGCPGTVGHRPN